MDVERLIGLGKQLGLTGKALQQWLEKERERERERYALEREAAKEYHERELQRQAGERQLLELRLRMQELQRASQTVPAELTDEFSCRLPRRARIFGEGRDPLKHDGQCSTEAYEAFAAHYLGVPLAAVTHNTSIVQDHLCDPLVNAGGLSCEDSAAVSYPNEVGENEQGLIKTETVELQVLPVGWDGVSRQNDRDVNVDTVPECTAKTGEAELELCSTLGEEKEPTFPTLAEDNRRTEANTPELRPVHGTPNGASLFILGLISKSAHTPFETFMKSDSIPAESSQVSTADRHRLSVDIADVIYRRRLGRRACGQRLPLAYTHYARGACTFERPTLLLCCNGRDASEGKQLQVSRLSSVTVKSDVRLVWDAIT